LKYCSDDCQREHWKLVHSKHCKKLAAAKKDEREGKNSSPMPVSILSNHPFPLGGLKEDVHEALLICVQTILWEMKKINHPAFSAFPNELKDFELKLAKSRAMIWFQRKTGVQGTPSAHNFPAQAHVLGREKDPLGLWPMLFLFLGRIKEHLVIVDMKSLKQPREAIPEELWENFDEGQIKVFLSRLYAMFKALGRPQFPSFEELLKIYCGGSLAQVCSFCTSPMSVAAVFGEVEGCLWVPLVRIAPCLPPLFCCGSFPCTMLMQIEYDKWGKWGVAVLTTTAKLEENRCDSCFKLASQVHRCTKCLTKTYCSKNCWKEDWEVKHKLFCRKDPVDRKVKGDSILRRQNQEEIFEKYKSTLSGQYSGAIKEEVMKVALSCQKLEIKGKEEGRVKKVRVKGGKLLKPVKSGEKVQGRKEEDPVLEADLKVKSESMVGNQKQDENSEVVKSGVGISDASKEKALKAVQSCQGSKFKEERRVKKTRANGRKLAKLVKSEEELQGREKGGLGQEVD